MKIDGVKKGEQPLRFKIRLKISQNYYTRFKFLNFPRMSGPFWGKSRKSLQNPQSEVSQDVFFHLQIASRTSLERDSGAIGVKCRKMPFGHEFEGPTSRARITETFSGWKNTVN